MADGFASTRPERPRMGIVWIYLRWFSQGCQTQDLQDTELGRVYEERDLEERDRVRRKADEIVEQESRKSIAWKYVLAK
jgi:hypothetical protein